MKQRSNSGRWRRLLLLLLLLLLKSVEFDDDVVLLLSVAGLVMGPHVTSESESEAQTLLHLGHRGPVFGFVEAVWLAARRSSEVVIQPHRRKRKGIGIRPT